MTRLELFYKLMFVPLILSLISPILFPLIYEGALFLSFSFLFIMVLQSTRISKLIGFPSIKEAKKYYKELNRVKVASRKAKAKAEFKLKMEKLEEEKKKYL
jgi:hypothetical protein